MMYILINLFVFLDLGMIRILQCLSNPSLWENSQLFTLKGKWRKYSDVVFWLLFFTIDFLEKRFLLNEIYCKLCHSLFFGGRVGTAVVVCPVKSILYQDTNYDMPSGFLTFFSRYFMRERVNYVLFDQKFFWVGDEIGPITKRVWDEITGIQVYYFWRRRHDSIYIFLIIFGGY